MQRKVKKETRKKSIARERERVRERERSIQFCPKIDFFLFTGRR